jgi:very-short-patch-repair endonuclease
MSEEFCCDIDDLVDKLSCKKHNLLAVLKREFQDGIDYVHHTSRKSPTASGGRPRGIYFLKESCMRQLMAMYVLTSRRKTSVEEFNLDYIKRYLPKEIETLDFVCTALSGVYTCVRQQRLLNYRVDLYFPDQRVVVECDEHGHVDRDQEYERRREQDLKRALNCTFVRFNPDADDFCLAKLISRILCALAKASP